MANKISRKMSKMSQNFYLNEEQDMKPEEFDQVFFYVGAM